MGHYATQLKTGLEESRDVYDLPEIHHEFSNGSHGRKLDFDKIPDESELFKTWILAIAEKLDETYTENELEKAALLSVANGTNRVVPEVAKLLGNGAVGLLTKKDGPKKVKLTEESEIIIRKKKPSLVVAVEDVGTTGNTTATAILSAREAGAQRVEAITTWQRRERLEGLLAINAIYHSVIFEPLIDFEPDICREAGFCSLGWVLIERQQDK